MALIVCPECGNKISSLARFCPKCDQLKHNLEQKTPRLVARVSSGDNLQEKELPPHTESTRCAELLQREFKPSLDEMILLEGRTFLVKGTFTTLDCYAYLTSKRYVVCDASGVNIALQVDIKEIVFAEESHHLLSRKIAVTTASGEMFQVKSYPHGTWLSALREPMHFMEAAKKSRGAPSNIHASAVDWFYEADGVNVGPVSEKIIVQLILNRHTVFPDTKVWNASLPEWKRAEDTILTIYFSESATSRVAQGRKTPFRITGLGLWNNVVMLFKKYF